MREEVARRCQDGLFFLSNEPMKNDVEGFDVVTHNEKL